ncbi:MAG: UDP-N-acetylglucosamine 1-carboxyvinyltransferase [Clostridiales bacterium]|nr:UDP-N-acetylglucosamine 1-carboxyvinyltransferase [Clostridiales bacterium]
MEAFLVEGGARLEGTLRVDGAKNAVLPILAAAILTEDAVTLEDVPRITDAMHMAEILTILGCRVEQQGKSMMVRSGGLHGWEMPDRLSKQIRSSIFLLGPILARFRKATVTYPGGCEIGLRPIDLHLRGLRSLGVKVSESGGMIYCDGAHMRSGDVYFDYPSVGATENVMMAAALLDGVTAIHNAAREPEIVDLQNFINAMGGDVRGAGSQMIEIRGVKQLRGVRYTPMADRIVAGTLLAAAAITGGEVELTNAPAGDMVAVLSKLREMGCCIHEEPERLHIRAPERLGAFAQLQTQPHPGFPTDMQVQMMALLSVAQGTGVILENVFENRFTHAGDLNRMGARILCSGRTAVVQGVEQLYGARVTARDLRGGAALVLAGLRAQGLTQVDQAHLVDRGYDHLETQLAFLGAKIRRIDI